MLILSLKKVSGHKIFTYVWQEFRKKVIRKWQLSPPQYYAHLYIIHCPNTHMLQMSPDLK
jgi:hypothetical protein